MPRSIQLVGACLLLAACAQPSQAPVVTAPSASVAAAVPVAAPPPSATAAASAAPAPSASSGPAASAGPLPPLAPSSTVPAQYRTCNTDADCEAVPRAGCCPHGWKEAVAVPQKDAYARDFACAQSPRPICPMFVVRDGRVARCDAREHLCEMVVP